MCDDLANAIEMNKEAGLETTKGAELLFKAAAKSMNKISNQIKEHIIESDKRDAQINARLDRIDEKLKRIEKKSEDATKWQLVVQICKALFGDVKRCILTTVWFSLILGAAHFSEIIDLLKALI